VARLTRGDALLRELKAEIALGGARFGIGPRAARELAEGIEEWLRLNAGGELLYIPVRDRARRNLALLAEFNGRNHAALCRRYRISRATLYRIVKKSHLWKS
jgi:Mor family transcriptional regulator